MTAPASLQLPSNVNELTEYHSVVSATGKDKEYCVPEFMLNVQPCMLIKS